MRTKVFLFLVVVSLIGLNSCSDELATDSVGGHEKSASYHSAKPKAESSIDDPAGLVAPFRLLNTLGENYSFGEGPAVDKHGNIFFTDQPNDKIYRWDAATGMITEFLSGTGRSNGMAFDKDGNLITCADLHGEVWKIFPDGSHEVLVDNYNDKLLNGPNDVWINPVTGGIYITDPIFPRGYWEAGDPRIQNWEPTHSEQAAVGKGGHVYYLAPGSDELIRVTDIPGWNDDSWPNGIVGTPDGSKLYVNQWSYNGSGGIWVFDISPDGTLSNTQPFVENVNFLDGMSMDEQGNVYTSGGPGIMAYDLEGNNILSVNVGGSTNSVFGGQNNKTLFITTGNNNFAAQLGKFIALQMSVKGVEKF